MGFNFRARLRACLSRGLAFGWVLATCPLLGPSISAYAGDRQLGPFGPEGPRLREQLWLLPSGDPAIALRATVFRPAEPRASEDAPPARFPMAIINHGTDEASRQAVSMPVFYWLSRWFVEHGYVVVLPQRRGHGATGGELAEGQDSCRAPDHYRAGQTAADDIEQALNYMAAQPFVDPTRTVVVGISTGGWASLALASRNSPRVRAVVNFAGGRGAFAGGRAGAVCGAERLIDAAGRFAKAAKTPTLWLYARNDRYFGPDLAARMAKAWSGSGGQAELHLLPPYGADGHTIADDRAGWRLWGGYVETFLAQTAPARPEPQPDAASEVTPQAALAH